MLPGRRSRREKGKGLRGRLARKKEKGPNTGGPCGTKRGKPIGRRSKKEAEDARVRRELWLSSDARVLRRGRGTEQRSRECDRDRILDWLKRRKMKQTQTEDRHLLGNECNFIVNLSLSESKQWYDLCTICPCNLLSPPPPPLPFFFFFLSLFFFLFIFLIFLVFFPSCSPPPLPRPRPFLAGFCGSSVQRLSVFLRCSPPLSWRADVLGKKDAGAIRERWWLAPRYRHIASIASVQLADM